MLKGKKILLAVTGSIAAYKIPLLVRLLIKQGAEIRIVMTPAAKEFVSPLVLSTLSRHEVHTELVNENTWANHVQLGRWADLMLIAPASCNTISKMANGQCDNLLLATYLSATCPVMVAPAMDEDMWKHPSLKENIARLQSYGNMIIPVEKGELASGLHGEGRMPEPESLLTAIADFFLSKDDFAGKTVLITAGPTYEAIDPVRFISNHSSGKMGLALAEEFSIRGAAVVLVLGPVQQPVNFKVKELIKVKSAEEMYNVCVEKFPFVDIAVMAAAVADYTPVTVAAQKIKKSDDDFAIELLKTKDILAALGAAKKHQLVVGFALETNNERENAIAKMEKKNADAIVLNSMNDAGAGFGVDTNKITVFEKGGGEHPFGLQSKKMTAKHIVDVVKRMMNEKN